MLMRRGRALSEVKQTSSFKAVLTAFDPKWTFVSFVLPDSASSAMSGADTQSNSLPKKEPDAELFRVERAAGRA